MDQPGLCCSSTASSRQGANNLPFLAPLQPDPTLESIYQEPGVSQDQAGFKESKTIPAEEIISNTLLSSLQAPDEMAIQMDKLARVGKRISLSSCSLTKLNCDNKSKFRSMNGSCNNLDSPNQGASHTPYRRLLSPSYSDAYMGIRKSVSGDSLPSARMVADKMILMTDKEEAGELSVHLMQWGQFLTHDLDHTPEVSPGPGKSWDCCGEDRGDPACAPIDIHQGDSFYGQHNKTCMSLTRSALAPAPGCKGMADQQNQITSYLDGSMIYGADVNTLHQIRQYVGGLLKSETGEMLGSSSSGECHIPQHTGMKCFKSGDRRTNEQPGLTLYHTIWHREHNRLATYLGSANSDWNDEELFQQTRRIVIAKLQHITYNEYLPLILGPTTMASLSLLPAGGSNFSPLSYNSSVNSAVSNAFATAALRFGHSMVPNNLSLSSTGCPRHNLMSRPLDSLFFNPVLLHNQEHFTECLAGLSAHPCPPPRPAFSSSLMGNLFINRDSGNKVGLDLVSINIQRGRDHGLPGYNHFRVLCGGKRAKHWSDYSDTFTEEQITQLTSVYSHVDDVDLYLAGLMEQPVQGSLLGQTFSCIVLDQMFRTMVGDRFFYSLQSLPNSFNPDQLEEVQKTSLARVLCDNSEVLFMQPLAFRTVSNKNPMVHCTSSSIPSMSIGAWKEEVAV